MAGPELATTTSNSVDTSTDNSLLLLNDTQMLSDNQEFLKLVTAPTASAGGLLVLIAAVLLVAGIIMCWSRRYKKRKSTSSPTASGNKLRGIDQRSQFTQVRGAPATVTISVFDIKENVAYQAYNFDEHVYAQPHDHAHQLKTYGDSHYDYEIATQY